MNIDKIMDKVLENAEKVRMDAAYGGHHHDGGASDMETQVLFYKYGETGVVPPEWETYVKQVNREEDPDYEVYLKLKDKFEG